MLSVIDLLYNSFKRGHPGDRQMAVHEEHPATTGQIIVDHLCGLGSLASTQGDLFALLGHVHVLSKALKARNWVRALGKHEDEWSSDITVFVGCLEIEDGWLDELLTHVLYNEVLHSKCELVCSERLDDQELLESIEFSVPIFGKAFFN